MVFFIQLPKPFAQDDDDGDDDLKHDDDDDDKDSKIKFNITFKCVSEDLEKFSLSAIGTQFCH